jgi:hypothetical protein
VFRTSGPALSVRPLGTPPVPAYVSDVEAVSESVTNVVRSTSNGEFSVAVCSGIERIEGGLSTPRTVIRNLDVTAAATPSDTLIVTSCVPTSSSAGVPEIVAGAVNASQLGSVGAVIVGVVPSGSEAVSVYRYVTPSVAVVGAAFVMNGGSLAAATPIVTVTTALCADASFARYVKVAVPLKFGVGV